MIYSCLLIGFLYMHHLLPVSESYLYALCAGDNNNLDIKGHYIYIVQILG